MKFSTVAAVIVGACAVAAQEVDLQDLPTCATSCGLQEFSKTDCGLEYECICNDNSTIQNVATCVKGSCGCDDQAKVLTFANKLCAPFNVVPKVTDYPADECPQPEDSSSSTNTTEDGDSTSTSTSSPSSTSSSSSGDKATYFSGAVVMIAMAALFGF